MKNHLLTNTAIAFTLSLTTVSAADWMTDFSAAKELAAKENKTLLVDFTGSDWCGWCVKLHEEVFSQESFKKGVAENFILVELDFPEDKSKISEETQKQNAELQKKYQVQQFPTILLMDAQGRPFAQTSYQPDGPDKYVIHLNELLKNGEAIKTSLNSADKLEGVKKAAAYIDAIKLVPETQLSHYQEILDQIPTLDPKDTTGFVAKTALNKKLIQLESEIETLFENEKSAEAPVLIDKFIAENTLEPDHLDGLEIMKLQINMTIADQAGDTDLTLKHVDNYVSGKKTSAKKLTNEETQEILSMKVGPLIRAKRFTEVAQLTDDIIAIEPDSEVAKMAKQFKAVQLPTIIKQAENPPHGAPGHIHHEGE